MGKFWQNEFTRLINSGNVVTKNKWSNVPEQVKQLAIQREQRGSVVCIIYDVERWGWCVLSDQDSTNMLLMGHIKRGVFDNYANK